MLAWLRAFFTPPSFADPEQTLIARFMYQLAVWPMAAGAAAALLLLVVDPAQAARSVLIGAGCVLAVGILLLVRRGHLQIAAWCAIGMFLVLTTFSMLMQGGVRGIGFGFYVLVGIAPFLVGRRSSFLVSAAAIGILIGLLLLEQYTSALPPYTPLEPRGATALHAAGLSVLMVFLGMVSSYLFDAVRQLRQNEQALLARNRELEVEISARREVEAALRRSETRYRIISEMIWDYAYAYEVESDGSLRPLWVTEDSFARLTGYPWEDIGVSYMLYHPDDRARAERDVALTLKGQEISAEYRIVTGSGETRWLHVRRRPLWDDRHERVVRLYGAAEDITDQKVAEQRRFELALEQERLEMLRVFISNITHDLKTPLTVINTSLHLISKRPEPDYVQQKLLVIGEQTARLGKLIEDMLTLSRLDFRLQLAALPLNLNDFLRVAVTPAAALCESKSIEFSLKLCPDELVVQADPDELGRAVMNLLENAVRYTLTGGSVSVWCRQLGDEVCIEVQDTGISISPDELPKVFERFYRSASARASSHEGSGLGLAIVRRIAEMHAGRVEAESEPGRGSTFRLILPLRRSAESAAPTTG